MSKQLSEVEVLKQLDIPDFRHMTKDKVINFASMLQNMDPEVAKKAIEQFPEFAKMSLEAFKEYRTVLEKIFFASIVFSIINMLFSSLVIFLES